MFTRRREQHERKQWAAWLDRHTLITDRFMLRPPMPEDREAYLATIDDEVRYWQGYDQAAVDRIGENFDFAVKDCYLHKMCPMWFVVETQGVRVAGSYSVDLDELAVDQGHPDGQVALGWWLGPTARGQGLATPTLRAFIDYVHLHIGVPPVAMSTESSNVRCRKQIEAANGVLLSSHHRTLPDGRTVEGVTYRTPAVDEDRWPPSGWARPCRRR